MVGDKMIPLQKLESPILNFIPTGKPLVLEFFDPEHECEVCIEVSCDLFVEKPEPVVCLRFKLLDSNVDGFQTQMIGIVKGELEKIKGDYPEAISIQGVKPEDVNNLRQIFTRDIIPFAIDEEITGEIPDGLFARLNRPAQFGPTYFSNSAESRYNYYH